MPTPDINPLMLADLGLDVSARGRGRAMVSLALRIGRNLEAPDLALLATERGIKPALVKRISDSHHAVARALASGLKPGEVSIITGYSLSRISILQADPAFQELLAFYRENLDVVYADLHTRMAQLSLDSAQLLQERMENDPDSFSNGALMDVLKLAADRTGHAPVSRTVSKVDVTVGFADALAAARKREEEMSARAIEAKPEPSRFAREFDGDLKAPAAEEEPVRE